MKKIFIQSFIILFQILLQWHYTFAQVPTNQDCLDAIPICQNVYSTTASYTNTGNYTTEIDASTSCLGSGEKNDVWYTFTVQQSGNLSFTITPNSGGDDYDWAVYNLTNNSCADIFSDETTLDVSCNYSGSTLNNGTTGPNGQGGSTLNWQNASGTQYNATIPVTVGQTYVVNVSNFSSSQSGYTIDFSASTAVIYDNIAPWINAITSSVGCGTNTITFNFSENILCSTIASCDITLTGPGGPYTVTSITGAGCATGGTQEKTFTITISPAIITSGVFNLNLAASVCNSVTDLCGNIAPAGSLPFNIIAITTSTSNVSASCGQNNGSASVTASGSSGTYTYTWNSTPVQTSATANNLSAGTYIVTVSDGSCSAIDTAVVSNVGGPTLSTSSVNAFCGNNNGSATATATGGSGNYTYSWSCTPAQTTQTATNLAPGNYSVTVNDGTCTVIGTVTVGNIPSFNATAMSTNENCGHANGTATATPTGGSIPYIYAWNSVPSQSTQTAINLPAGNYSVTITDANGCTATTTATVINIPGPSAAIANPINSLCGLPNGSAIVNPTGGSPPYTYQWNSNPPQYTQNLQNVLAGIYNVTVTDNFGCTATNTVTLTSSPGPTASITNIIGSQCNQSNGSLTITPNGGQPPYLYAWNTNPSQSGQTAANIPTGNYTVTVTDANGCHATSSGFVPTTNAPIANAISTNEYCGQGNGTATITVIGGTAPFTYLWNNGQTNTIAIGLAADIYTVTVTDGNSCTATATTNVMNIPGPTAGFSAQPKVLTLMDGPVTFVDNSTGNITDWFWYFGDSDTASGNFVHHQYIDLGEFLVMLIVTDNNGCKDTVTDTIKVKDFFTLYIPNSFSPNGDGKNDLFFPTGYYVNPDKFNMMIFDRWGNLYFNTNKWDVKQSEGWNGTKDNSGSLNDVVMDIYVYRIRLTDMDGRKHEYIGRIALLP
jgi:gliding motility-associated-like protein